MQRYSREGLLSVGKEAHDIGMVRTARMVRAAMEPAPEHGLIIGIPPRCRRHSLRATRSTGRLTTHIHHTHLLAKYTRDMQ